MTINNKGRAGWHQATPKDDTCGFNHTPIIRRIKSAQGTNHKSACNEIPTVKPTYPDPRYLPGRVLKQLLTGRRFTHRDSWLELGHSRLADSIWKLRKMGWPIQITEKTVSTSDSGRSATIGIYWLLPETIEAEGATGQRYASECDGRAA